MATVLTDNDGEEASAGSVSVHNTQPEIGYKEWRWTNLRRESSVRLMYVSLLQAMTSTATEGSIVAGCVVTADRVGLFFFSLQLSNLRHSWILCSITEEKKRCLTHTSMLPSLTFYPLDRSIHLV